MIGIRKIGLNIKKGIKGIPFLLTSTGDGTGVSTLTVTVSENTLFTLDGTAKFYSNAGGTDDESSTWIATTGAARTRYLKCPSDTANMYIATDTVTSWGAWTSGTNAARLSGDISQLTILTYLSILGNNIISGSIAGLTSLTYISLSTANTVSGSVAGLTSLTYLRIVGSNTVSGSLSGLTLLNFLVLLGANTVSGSLNGLTSLNAYIIISGLSTITGDLSLISTGVKYCDIQGLNQIVTYTAGGDWSAIFSGEMIKVIPDVGYGYSSAEVDLFINEIEATRTPPRAIHVTLTGSSAARTAASDVAVAAIIADGGTVTTNP